MFSDKLDKCIVYLRRVFSNDSLDHYVVERESHINDIDTVSLQYEFSDDNDIHKNGKTIFGIVGIRRFFLLYEFCCESLKMKGVRTL